MSFNSGALYSEQSKRAEEKENFLHTFQVKIIIQISLKVLLQLFHTT